MNGGRVVFRVHALQRMFQRRITREDVLLVLAEGEMIEDYADDLPYPSCLILGWREGCPLHVVAAYNADEDETVVVTVYEPDPSRWDATFRSRIQ